MKRIARDLSPYLNEKQALALLALMKEGRLTDTELKDVLGYSSVSAASRHRKKLEEKGIIKGYSAIVDWEKLGYVTRFLIIVEGESREALNEIARDHVLSTGEYLDNIGDMLITPGPLGDVILEEVMASFGEFGVIAGVATSEDAARSYCDLFLRERYSGAQMKLLLVRNVTIDKFFIQKEFIESYKNMLHLSERDRKRLKEFIETFPWDKLR